MCLSVSRKLFQRIMNSTCLHFRNAAIQHLKMDCESCESTNKDSIAGSSMCYVASALDNSLAGAFISFVLGVLLTPVWLCPHPTPLKLFYSSPTLPKCISDNIAGHPRFFLKKGRLSVSATDRPSAGHFKN